MIPGPELVAWLGDAERQRQSHARTDAFARAAADAPLIDDLRQAMRKTGGDPVAVRAAAEAFIARDDEISALIGDLIAAAAVDPFFRPPFTGIATDINSGLVLYDDPLLQVSAGVITLDALAAKKTAGASATSSISFTGLTSLFRVLKAGGAIFSFWEAPEVGPAFTAVDAGTCRMVGRRRLRDGETIALDGRRESFVIEHALSDIVHVQAVVKVGAGPLLAEYDSRTHRFAWASSTDEAASRMQMMISLLRLTERSDALPLLRGALDSPHFYTRWYVMREFLAMDAEAALPSLRAMAAGDSHPEVRAAARQTLLAFFADEECEQPCLA